MSPRCTAFVENHKCSCVIWNVLECKKQWMEMVRSWQSCSGNYFSEKIDYFRTPFSLRYTFMLDNVYAKFCLALFVSLYTWFVHFRLCRSLRESSLSSRAYRWAFYAVVYFCVYCHTIAISAPRCIPFVTRIWSLVCLFRSVDWGGLSPGASKFDRKHLRGLTTDLFYNFLKCIAKSEAIFWWTIRKWRNLRLDRHSFRAKRNFISIIVPGRRNVFISSLSSSSPQKSLSLYSTRSADHRLFLPHYTLPKKNWLYKLYTEYA